MERLLFHQESTITSCRNCEFFIAVAQYFLTDAVGGPRNFGSHFGTAAICPNNHLETNLPQISFRSVYYAERLLIKVYTSTFLLKYNVDAVGFRRIHQNLIQFAPGNRIYHFRWPASV